MRWLVPTSRRAGGGRTLVGRLTPATRVHAKPGTVWHVDSRRLSRSIRRLARYRTWPARRGSRNRRRDRRRQRGLRLRGRGEWSIRRVSRKRSAPVTMHHHVRGAADADAVGLRRSSVAAALSAGGIGGDRHHRRGRGDVRDSPSALFQVLHEIAAQVFDEADDLRWGRSVDHNRELPLGQDEMQEGAIQRRVGADFVPQLRRG